MSLSDDLRVNNSGLAKRSALKNKHVIPRRPRALFADWQDGWLLETSKPKTIGDLVVDKVSREFLE